MLVVVALLIFLWGFRRYQRSFSKTEFGVATAIALGTLVIALVPDLFNALGNVLQIERRPLVISLVATILLTALVLYVIGRLCEQQLAVAEREHGKKPKVRYALGLMRTIFVTWIR
ncbi:Uncharacterized conserved protein [Halorientalis persicus]|uniref:Uncharacterized conserved protein n=1 Tax=Halorientalis persicus TaxID=1367881 RepID=A0A1H8DEC0_9EURY|nr:DUF2304 family protein [Halorientalis persicus]SEN05445.1 Uncharacterized conserved protein [Halorientalis persicus]